MFKLGLTLWFAFTAIVGPGWCCCIQRTLLPHLPSKPACCAASCCAASHLPTHEPQAQPLTKCRGCAICQQQVVWEQPKPTVWPDEPTDDLAGLHALIVPPSPLCATLGTEFGHHAFLSTADLLYICHRLRC